MSSKYPLNKKDPHIRIRFDRAIKHLMSFIDDSSDNFNRSSFQLHMRTAISTSAKKLVNYQISKKVNMEKVELLRDTVFLGTSLMETTVKNSIYFRATIASCFDIVEQARVVKFDEDFIKKIVSSKDEFMHVDNKVNTVSLYFLFKSHFRYSDK